MKKLIILINIICVISLINADVYMHAPRGSNNRLNERSANRRTPNRVFDSQNNNRGGYNVGDRTAQSAGNQYQNQFELTYFASSAIVNKKPETVEGRSVLPIEWTNQHGSGGDEDTSPNKLNTNMVLQFLVQPETGKGAAWERKSTLRDGVDANRQQYANPDNDERENRWIGRRNQINQAFVMQEQMEWYDKCNVRDRNEGLFTADQNVGNDAQNTRQNPNGNRNGYECPEERDYYPYWHPTEWKDIAIMAENISMCEYYKTESFNVKPKFECMETWKDSTTRYKHYSEHNNEKDCTDNGGKWLDFVNYLERTTKTEAECTAANNNAANKANNIKYVWGRPMLLDDTGDKTAKECLVALAAPDCIASQFSRVNHLGNGAGLEDLNYNWVLPHFPSGIKQNVVLRLRYNISTDDYDPWKTDASSNRDPQAGVQSPVEQNPAVDIGALNIPMRLAINTAQFGRTFQDRSHMFIIEQRPDNVQNEQIMNVGVRGKRGNIVQVYPAVEYDFYPTNMTISPTDLVHFQWAGSNSHNNGNPAGDGQAGDDGEGRKGTDRSNILGLADRVDNFPLPIEDSRNLIKKSKLKWAAGIKTADLPNYNYEDVAAMMASSGYYQCVKTATCGAANSIQGKTKMNNLLDNAPASFPGVMLQIEKGTYNYMCSRNNNFSNRSQKGTIIVKDP